MAKSRANVAGTQSADHQVPLYGYALVIVVVGVVAHWPSFHGVFLLDDDLHIVANPVIKKFWPIWPHLSDPDRPIVRLSLALNHALGGLNTLGYHIFNLVVHLAAAITLFGLLRRTLLRLKNQRRGDFATGLAFAAALLWVVHPLTTQAVTYVIQRGESMMALFCLLTMYCVAIGATARRAWPWYGAAVLACAAGMGSKEVMISAPIVVLIYDRLFLAETWRSLARKRWALYLALAATGLILRGSGAAAGLTGANSLNAAAVGFGYQGVTPWQYLFSQPDVILHYLRLVIWPHPLCFDYDWPPASVSAETIAAGMAMMFLLGLTVWTLLRNRLIGFLGAAFFLILAPTSSFVPIKDLAVEHRMYLPLAAVIALLVLLFDWLTEFLTKNARLAGVTKFAMLSMAVVVLGAVTVHRNGVYGSAVLMWDDVVTRRPDNARAWSHLGNAQMEAGRVNAAIDSFRASLRCKPDWAEIENNLGNALVHAGRVEEAVQAFTDALAHGPVLVHVHLNLGMVFHKLGRLNEAIEHYRTGLSASPHLVTPRNNLGIALRDLGRLAEAEEAHRAALRYAPDDAATHDALGYVLELEGKLREAAWEYREALRITPGNSGTRARLQALDAKIGRANER